MPSYGFSPSLPLIFDNNGPYSQLSKINEVVKQNLKMLVLTSPGERIMIPEYGVGIRNYLFELNSPETKQNIRARINHQVNQYMPFLEDMQISFPDVEERDHSIHIRIEYFIGPIGKVDFLDLALSSNVQKIS